MDKNYFLMRSFIDDEDIFKVGQLSEIWKCSDRTTRRRLQKYVSDEKIGFKSGNGRGKLSKIFFIDSYYNEFVFEVENAIRNKEYENLAFMLHLNFPKEWLYNYLENINELFQNIQHDKYKTIFQSFFSRKLYSLDPILNFTALEAFILSHIGNTLFNYDAKKNKIQPGLVHHWKWIEEDNNWVFFIRKGVNFHNGQILTASDIEYSLNRVTKSRQYGWLFQALESITVKGNFELVLKMKKKNNFDILRALSLICTTIIPKNMESFDSSFVGTGPFKIVKNNMKKVMLETFEYYHGYRPMIDGAEFWILNNDSMLPFFDNDNQSIKISDGFSYLVFNNKSETFYDIKKRKYIANYILSTLAKPKQNGYFDDSIFFKKYLNQICSNEKNKIKKISIGFFEGALYQQEVSNIRHELEKIDINVSLIKISKKDFFMNSDLNLNFDILLAGESPSDDKEFSFFSFIFSESMPIQRLLPQKVLTEAKIKFMNKNNASTTNITRSIENNLISNFHIIYLEKKFRSHAFLDELLPDKLTNTYGFLDLNNIWMYT